MQIWFLIAAILVNLSLSLVILSKVRKSSATAYFAISSLFVVFWATGTLLMLHSAVQGLAVLGLILFLVAPMATTLYMVLFAKNFAETTHTSNTKLAIFFTFIMAAIAILTMYGLLNSDKVLHIHPDATNAINLRSPWFLTYGVYFAVMFVVAYTYLIIGSLRHRGRMRAQIRIVLTGIFATSFLSLITNIVLPLLGNTSLLWVGPASTIFYIVATSYSMIKHRLFDLRSALVLTFTYGLSLAALAAIYYMVAFGVSAFFVPDQAAQGQHIWDVALALVLAFLFQPIRGFFDKVTSQIFYQDSYSAGTFFATLSHILSTTTDLQLLLRKSSDVIAGTVKAKNVTFLVYNGEHHLVEVSSDGPRKTRIPYADARWLDTLPSITSGNPIISSLLDEDDRHLKRLMLSHKAVIIFPLVRQDVIIGYIFMGEHYKGSYATRDIHIIRSISDELAIGVENALSLKKVRDLNAHLEQRIDAATKELRTSNAQLQKLDEAKDEFISMASHQLRTPLTSIKGYVSMLMDGDVGEVSKEQKHLLEEAFISSERMVRLIGDFLNVSRLQTGKFVIDKRPVDLSKIVSDEVKSLETNAQSRGMKFIYKTAKNIPLLNLDENKIQQVIMNFCDNAIYYSKDNAKIRVDLSVVNNQVQFTVKDSGIGVPVAERSQLFTKFFRATNARKQRPDGTGVGLFLAKKVVDEHGGTIIFESEEGKGSTFGFRLPIKKI